MPCASPFSLYEHLFKAGFLDIFEPVQLTLMKGDKVVEGAKKGAYFSLFILSFWIINICVPHCRFRDRGHFYPLHKREKLAVV
jgi:hypothetical protein